MPQVPCGQMILFLKTLRKHILKYDLNKKGRKGRAGWEGQALNVLSLGGGRVPRTCC